jgi:predicted dehydrogenase
MSEVIRWGILGTGNIAHQFARGLAVLPDAALVAVGSRAQETADAFGAEFDVSNRHASYEALAADAEVDVVYISTPHPFHHANTLLCLNGGKHVLCEKPFAMNAQQAREMIATARAHSLFLMDAIWTRFLPAMVKTRKLLAKGAIGDVRMLLVDFGFRAQFNPEARLFNPKLGGGALLDVGIYTVQLASMVMGGPPSEIAALAALGETGVDEQTAMTLKYAHGQLAQLSCAVRTATRQEAWIYGTEGRLHLHSPWWRGTKVSLWQATGSENGTTLDLPFEGNGYNYEAAEVMRCIRAGRLESDVMPLDESLELMETLDAARAQWGLQYPDE